MKTIFGTAMQRVTQLTREQKIVEAARLIKRTLLGEGHASLLDKQAPERSIDRAGGLDAAPHHAPAARAKKPLGEVLTLLRQGDLPGLGNAPAPFVKLRKAPPVPVPGGAQYLTRSFTSAAGSRDYKLYIPSKFGETRALIVMLHGCTQNPDDFALGTGMNGLAEEHGFIVAYPGQKMSANHSACWNWFQRADQLRDAGEPSIIAGITRALMGEHDIGAGRVYVAGLSAGGAMAAVMCATYPELYAAAGIHSGLAYGSASDLASAFAAMKGTQVQAPPTSGAKSAKSRVRAIVFHGTADQTVHPSNAERIFAEARMAVAGPAKEMRQRGSAGGRPYTRTLITGADGASHVEYWAVEGLGHAWSGGRPEGSYADPQGPDASLEMLRFFLGGPARTPAR